MCRTSVLAGIPFASRLFLLLNKPVPVTDYSVAELRRVAAVIGYEGDIFTEQSR